MMIFYFPTNKNDCSTMFEEKNRIRTNAVTFASQSGCNHWIASYKIDCELDAFLKSLNWAVCQKFILYSNGIAYRTACNKYKSWIFDLLHWAYHGIKLTPKSEKEPVLFNLFRIKNRQWIKDWNIFHCLLKWEAKSEYK